MALNKKYLQPFYYKYKEKYKTQKVIYKFIFILIILVYKIGMIIYK